MSAIISFVNSCCNFNLDFLCLIGVASVGSVVVYFRATWCPSQRKLKEKTKKICPQKIPYISGNGTSSSNIKKILIFLEIKPCTFRPQSSKFSLKEPALKKFLIFSQKKAFLIFLEI